MEFCEGIINSFKEKIQKADTNKSENKLDEMIYKFYELTEK